MFNAIKMDLYRMVRTKSFYVIGMILAIVTISTTYLTKIDYDEYKKEIKSQQTVEEMGNEQEMSNEQETTNLGIIVDVPYSDDEVTLYDIVYGNLRGMAVAVFLVIFAVLYGSADINSGFIKNIGGQVRNRGVLIVSKAIALFFYTVITIGFYILVQALSNQIFFGSMEWGGGKESFVYLMTQVLLHYALVIICMAIAVILKSNVISMILSLCLCMNLLQILYGFIDKMAAKIGFENFHMVNYTVTGKISMLFMEPTVRQGVVAAGIAAIFIFAAVIMSSVVFMKRDI